MIELGLIIYFVVLMILSVIFLWAVTKSMENYKKVIMFLPFFFMGIIQIFKLGFSLSELYEESVWGILEICFSICFIGIIIVIRRFCKWH